MIWNRSGAHGKRRTCCKLNLHYYQVFSPSLNMLLSLASVQCCWRGLWCDCAEIIVGLSKHLKIHTLLRIMWDLFKISLYHTALEHFLCPFERVSSSVYLWSCLSKGKLMWNLSVSCWQSTVSKLMISFLPSTLPGQSSFHTCLQQRGTSDSIFPQCCQGI